MIKQHSEHSTLLCNTKPGDVFELDGMLFIRVESHERNGADKSVRLCDGKEFVDGKYHTSPVVLVDAEVVVYRGRNFENGSYATCDSQPR